MAAIAQEPVDVYGAPLFLPAALAGQRDAIWTEARQQQVIDAAVANHVAIEINGALRLPGEAFVRKAKAAGATVHARPLRRRHAGRRLLLRHPRGGRPVVARHVRARPPAHPRRQARELTPTTPE